MLWKRININGKECKTCKNRTLCCSGNGTDAFVVMKMRIFEKRQQLIRSEEGYELYKMRSKALSGVWAY